MRFDATRALIAYSGVVTAALVWTFLSGATASPIRELDTLEVHRVNIRENDGTIRLIIASRDHFPGLIAHNKERPHPTRTDTAGMIFLNDEGTENGGLVFRGEKIGGKVVGFGHLSFDQYEQDQVINLEQTEDAGQREGGLTIDDRPDTSIDFDLEDRLARMPPGERDATIAKLRTSGAFGRHRLFIGKSSDRAAVLALRDGDGRIRLKLSVTAAGAASIEFLDATGKVVRTDSAQGSTRQ
jgi:hypothetical protein